MMTVTMPGRRRIARNCFQAFILSHLLEHHRPAPVNPRFFNRPESNFRGNRHGLPECLAGNVNLGFGHKKRPARLEAAVNSSKQPSLIRHFMDHHESQGEIDLGINRQPILIALMKSDSVSHFEPVSLHIIRQDSGSILQLKQLRQRLQQHVRDAVARFVAERFQRRMQQLVDQTVERLADLVLRALVKFRKPGEEPL
jgi:hypothetical protein